MTEILLPSPIIIGTEAIPSILPLRQIPKEHRKQFLKSIYVPDILADANESGICELVNGNFRIVVSLKLPSIAGLLFEAFIVRKAAENKEFRKELYMWIKNGKRKPSDKEIDDIRLYGLGFPKNKIILPQGYAPNHFNIDVGVLKKSKINTGIPYISPVIFHDNALSKENNLLFVTHKNGTAVGAQIKAITTNEKAEIIEPILNKQYSHVITLLRNNKAKKHTMDVCRDILDKMCEKEEIDHKTRYKIERSIRTPESLGLKQEEIDEYYETIQYWYQDGMKNGGIIENPLGNIVANSLNFILPNQ